MSFNKRLLTLEDANSILAHFNKGFVDYYELDTRLLTTVDTWFAYDFIDVYRVTGSISFNVKNSLWTGGFRVVDCNIESPSVSVGSDGVTVTGTGLEWVVLLLELSPEFNHGAIFELDYQVEYTPVMRPFYEDIALTMGFLDGETPVTGMTVTDKITGETLTTDSDGLVTVTAPLDKAGDYDYVLEAENNGVTVEYKFPYIRLKTDIPVRLVNDTVYRDKMNQLTFEFLYGPDYQISSELLFEDNDLVLIVDNVEYQVDGIDGNQFSFNVPLGSRDRLTMKLLIDGNDYLDNSIVEFNVPVETVTVSTASELKAELESELSASVVVFDGSVLDTEVTISKKVLIRFTDLIESNVDNVFNVVDGAVLSVDGCNFTGKTLVTLDDGECILSNCNFTHCTRPVLNGNGNATVVDCQFIDNVTGIQLTGDLELVSTLFDLSDNSYYTVDSVAFIECYGDLTVDYCQFGLNVDDVARLGFGYVFFLLGKASVVNNVPVAGLLQNEVFPFRKCSSDVDVYSESYHITGKDAKCVVWTVEDSNTAFSNRLSVEYVGGD